MQKNRERHCFLFETAAIICKKAESTKEYIPKYSISTRKMTWEVIWTFFLRLLKKISYLMAQFQ